MSTDEKDAIVGKAIREEQEYQAELARISYQLAELVEGFDKFTELLRNRAGSYSGKAAAPMGVPEVIAKYADLTKITELANSRIEIEKKLERIGDTLTQLNVRKPV